VLRACHEQLHILRIVTRTITTQLNYLLRINALNLSLC